MLSTKGSGRMAIAAHVHLLRSFICFKQSYTWLRDIVPMDQTRLQNVVELKNSVEWTMHCIIRVPVRMARID